MIPPQELEPYAACIELSFGRSIVNAGEVTADLLRRIAIGCEEAGASLIGHIKCYAETSSGQYLHCGLTSTRIGPKCQGTAEGPCESIHFDINVLVYGLQQQTIAAVVTRSLQELSQAHRCRFTLEPFTHEDHHHEDGHHHQEEDD